MLKPYYHEDGITIYNADCKDILPHLPKVDLVLTDPPYGINVNTDWSKCKSSPRFAKEKGVLGGNKYDKVIGDERKFNPMIYMKYLSDIKEQFWFGINYYCTQMQKDLYNNGSLLVWDKRITESFDRIFGSCFELIWSKKKHKQEMLRFRWAGIFGVSQEDLKKRVHPTQKPIALIKTLINKVNCNLILDPFMGSGTTLVAAKQLGRQAIGIELEKKYCDIAIDRLGQQVFNF